MTAHLAPDLLKLLVRQAREHRRPITAGEVRQALSEQGHAVDAQDLAPHLRAISRKCEHFRLPDLASLVCGEETGAPEEGWRPDLPQAERLVSGWEEQAKAWAFDEWLKYEEVILALQKLGN